VNANELALFQDDLAKEWEYEGIEAKELRESATMLRQQQAKVKGRDAVIDILMAEIDFLKIKLADWEKWNKESRLV
jgi:hypothetical protein